MPQIPALPSVEPASMSCAYRACDAGPSCRDAPSCRYSSGSVSYTLYGTEYGTLPLAAPGTPGVPISSPDLGLYVAVPPTGTNMLLTFSGSVHVPDPGPEDLNPTVFAQVQVVPQCAWEVPACAPSVVPAPSSGPLVTLHAPTEVDVPFVATHVMSVQPGSHARLLVRVLFWAQSGVEGVTTVNTNASGTLAWRMVPQLSQL